MSHSTKTSQRVLLLYQNQTLVIERLHTILGDYFGNDRIEAIRHLGDLDDAQAIIVVLLSRGPLSKPSPGFPLSDFDALAETGICRRLADQRPIIPILLDGAVMPSVESIPPHIRPLSFRHALPIRTGETFTADLGRLICDLEEHLDCYPDSLSRWDNWLLPIGLIGSLVLSPFLILWLLDAWYWNYAYETDDYFQHSRFVLTVVGPMLFGCFLMISGGAILWRQYRYYMGRRCDQLRSGSGDPAKKRNWYLYAGVVLAIVSVPWSWWAGVPALLITAVGATRSFPNQQSRMLRRSLILGCVIAVVACSGLWHWWRGRFLDQLGDAVAAYEVGVEHLLANRLDEAELSFQSSTESFPRFGNAYQGLAAVYAKQGDKTAEIERLTQAIEYYPKGSRGLFEPDRSRVGDAYRRRAELWSSLGEDGLSEKDAEMAENVDPWLNLFSGWLRFW